MEEMNNSMEMKNSVIFNNSIEMKSIRKTFGKVIANNNVNLTVRKGEIHALLGENGAGKSTLMNMLSGVYRPDSGEIFVKGKEAHIKSPKDAIKMGIGMIYQHFKLIDVMTAAENIVLGQREKFITDEKSMNIRIHEISHKFGLGINPSKKVYDMSVGERQTLEILKVLYRGADILVLDEPTAVLTPQETKRLFEIMNKMKNSGCSIIFITHKMNEVMEVADRITVLRKGETVGTVEKSESSPKKLTELMVGRPVSLEIKRLNVELGREVLRVKNINALNSHHKEILHNISFELRAGEILGVAGVAGSGQKELCESIAGLYKIKSGEILYENESIKGLSPIEIIKRGISFSFVPEDRLGMGLVASMGMVDNIVLKQYQSQKGLFIDRKPSIEKAHNIKEKLNIHTPDIHHPVRMLSGGNIQKVLIGRELDTNPHLLIMAYPVRGLDINTSYSIYDLLNEQKSKGVAILFVAEDLDVLLELSDRVMIMFEGKIAGILEAEKTTKEEVGLLMTGNKLTFGEEIPG